MIAQSDMPEGYRLVVARPELIRIEDAANPKLFLQAECEGGELWFYVLAVEEDGTRGTVRGKELFELMVRHFGPLVDTVVGFWTKGINLTLFLNQIRDGKTALEAAAETWTGRQASRHGFIPVHVENHEGLPRFARADFRKAGTP